MRTHDRYREYTMLHNVADARRFVSPERLVAVRYEPVMAVLPEATISAIFERDGHYMSLAQAYVLNSMLELRETPPVVWPKHVRGFAPDTTFDALDEMMEPWLLELMLANYANDPCLKFFTDDAAIRADVERAAAERLYGVCGLVDAMRSAGPYVYAYRFLDDARVAIRDAGGANGAALVHGRCRSVAFDSGDAERDAFVRRWFGAHRFDGLEDGAYDVAFVDANATVDARTIVHTAVPAPQDRVFTLAHPVPTVSMVSLDIEDSIPDRRFGVQTDERVELRRSSIEAPIASGGSGGRVLLVVRDDWTQIDDADTDAIRTLSAWLSREGFEVCVAGSGARLDPASADVVHVIGHRHVRNALPSLRLFAQAGVPIVAAPYADDPRDEVTWGGAISLFAYRNALDAELLDLYSDTIARRRLTAHGVDGLPNTERVANPELAELLSLSGAAIASGAEEEQLLREVYGYRNPVLPSPGYVEPVVPEAVETLAGCGEFILVHAPIEPAASLLFVLAAAGREGLPLVWTGPVANHELLHYVRAYASDRCYYIPPALLSPAQTEGLYARARVYLDASWASRGLTRVARAASYGATIVGSTHGYARDVLGDGAYPADPGSVASIASAMREAWFASPHRRHDLQGRASERFSGISALVSTVTAYSQAAAAKSPA